MLGSGVALAATLVAILATAMAVRLWTLTRRGRRAVGELHASREHYRVLASNLPEVSVLLFDLELRFTLVEGALEVHGWQPDTLLGHQLGDVLPAKYAALLQPHFERAVRGEASSVTIDATNGHYLADVVPVRDAEGDVVAGMAVVRDITEQRANERRRELLGAVVGELSEGLMICDEHGRLLRIDPESRELRPEPEQADPLDWAEALDMRTPDGRRRLKAAEVPLYRALHGEIVHGAEVSARGRVTLATGRPVTGPGGEALGAVVLSVDLTRRRATEAQLRESEQRYRTVVEGVRDTVFQTDLQGRWTFLSGGFEVATGFAVPDMLGRPSNALVHPDDRAAHTRAFAPLATGEAAFVRHRHRVITASGVVRWAEVRAQLLRGEEDAPTGIAGVVEDVTDSHRAQQYGAAERAVLDRLASATDEASAMPGLLEALTRHLGWDLAELWTPDEAGERLLPAAAWRRDAGPPSAFERMREGLGYEMGDGVAGLAWAQRTPVWSPDFSEDPRQPRHAAAVESGLRSALAVPISRGHEPLGVVLLVSSERREPERSMDRLLEAIASHIAQFVERRRAERHIAEQAADLAVLSESAHRLASETDVDAAGLAIAGAAVEVAGADCAALWLPDGDELVAVAAVGADVAGVRLAVDAAGGTALAFRTGEPVYADVEGDPVRANGWTAATGSRSAFWQPVTHEGETVAVLALGWTVLHPELGDRRREMLRVLATEAAIAVERARLLDQLRSTARTDALTGLANRRAWNDELARELARARRYGEPLCLAVLDLDHFGRFNDTEGRLAGDELLAEVARLWPALLRPTDLLARYDGEAFGLLLPHCELEFADAIVERLLLAVPGGQTASCGIAAWDGGEPGDALVARADAALRDAKRAGRGRSVCAVA